MNQTLKRYLISSGVTFLSTFLAVVAIQLQDFSTAESLTGASIVGILIVGARAGVKATAEYLSGTLK